MGVMVPVPHLTQIYWESPFRSAQMLKKSGPDKGQETKSSNSLEVKSKGFRSHACCCPSKSPRQEWDILGPRYRLPS